MIPPNLTNTPKTTVIEHRQSPYIFCLQWPCLWTIQQDWAHCRWVCTLCNYVKIGYKYQLRTVRRLQVSLSRRACLGCDRIEKIYTGSQGNKRKQSKTLIRLFVKRAIYCLQIMFATRLTKYWNKLCLFFNFPKCLIGFQDFLIFPWNF